MRQRLDHSLQMKPQQRLVMTMNMQSALHVLQMGIMELKDYLEEEIEQNPLLEGDGGIKAALPDYLPEALAKTSLSDILLAQAREAFPNHKELRIAEIIIANLDHRGYLSESVSSLAEELHCPQDAVFAVLKIIQTFEPFGIAARDLQECLLIQLKNQNKEHTLAYEMIEKHFYDLAQGRMQHLRKKLKLSPEEMQKKVLQELRPLHFHPGKTLEEIPTTILYPDLFLRKVGSKWIVDVNEKELPSFRFNPAYSGLLEKNISPQERKTLRGFMAKGKWLMRSINRRRKILKDIALYLIKKQQGFLQGKASLQPLSAKDVAEELNLNESTVARALSEKYIETPFGIKPLRFLLSHALINDRGEKKSTQAALAALKHILEHEDKSQPFTDQELSEKMQTLGFTLARRTIVKYRKGLKAPSKRARKRT